MLNTRVWEEMGTDPSKEELPGRSFLRFEDEDSECRPRDSASRNECQEQRYDSTCREG